MADFADTHFSRWGKGLLVGDAKSTVSSGTATISVGGEQITANVRRDLTLAVNDKVLIGRVGSFWVVIDRLGTAAISTPPEVEIPPPPKPATTSGRLIVSPASTRSYRTSYGWRTDNAYVYQGEYGGYGNHTGCVFYGSKPRTLTGKTVTSASVRVTRRNEGGVFAAQTSTLRLMTDSTKPAGAPTLTSSTTGPRLARGSTDTSFTVPTAWIQAIVDGTAGGLALFTSSGSPYMIFDGRPSSSWTLTINWRS